MKPKCSAIFLPEFKILDFLLSFKLVENETENIKKSSELDRPTGIPIKCAAFMPLIIPTKQTLCLCYLIFFPLQLLSEKDSALLSIEPTVRRSHQLLKIFFCSNQFNFKIIFLIFLHVYGRFVTLQDFSSSVPQITSQGY